MGNECREHNDPGLTVSLSLLLHVYYMFTTRLLHVYYMFTTRLLHVYYTLTTRLLYAYYALNHFFTFGGQMGVCVNLTEVKALI